MSASFNQFVELCRKSKGLCPWAKSQSTEDYANEIKSETDEAIEAIKSGDKKRMTDELGDVLNDWVHTVLTAGLDPEEVIASADAKIRRRKPFLAENKTVTLEEAKAIWKKVKEKENNG